MDEKAFLHAKSEHLRSLKNSLSYSHTLRLKIFCSTTAELLTVNKKATITEFNYQ